MTAPHIVDPAGLLVEALGEASPDLMRSMLQTMINALLSADADAVVGAEWGKPTDRKSTRLNSSHVASSYAVFCLKKKTGPAPTMTRCLGTSPARGGTIWRRPASLPMAGEWMQGAARAVQKETRRRLAPTHARTT